jgi:hypothetical protein
MCNEDCIYFSGDVKFTDDEISAPERNGSYNNAGALQFNMYPATTAGVGNALGEFMFFSYHPRLADGQPAVGEHFTYGDGGSGQDVPEAKIAVVFNNGGYTMEGLIPKEALAKTTPAFDFRSGGNIYMCIITITGNVQCIMDCQWFDGETVNVYTLSDKAAGIQPVPEAVPEVIADEPAPEAVAPVVDNSPKTGNSALLVLMFVMAAAIAAKAFRFAKNK